MKSQPLISVSALMWGLQAAFLAPALAPILVGLFGANPGDLGLVMAIYNICGFVSSLIIPTWADRHRAYIQGLGVCAVLTLGVAIALLVVPTLGWATAVLIVLGGPASVGGTLLFAHLMHTGAKPDQIMNVRAVFSFSWVAGPPMATWLMDAFGPRAPLYGLAILTVINLVIIAFMRRGAVAPTASEEAPARTPWRQIMTPHLLLVMTGFTLANCTNSAAVAIIALLVTDHLHLPAVWAGAALGTAAALEIPALLGMGRLTNRVSEPTMLVTACIAGVGYYVGMTMATSPVALLALQVLNAWYVAGVSGIGLTLFQRLVPEPGLANGLFSNTRQIGAILAGPLIAIAGGPWGYAGTYRTAAVFAAVAAVIMAVSGRQDPDARSRAD